MALDHFKLDAMQSTIQDALDNLSSIRSSRQSKLRALETLEHIIATAHISVQQETSTDLSVFLALQYSFECNVPIRLLSWIASSTATLEALTNKGSMNNEKGIEAAELSSQISLSLSIMQGIVLNHASSKVFLGRKYGLEVLIDLLLASRHVPSASSIDSNPQTTLSSAVVDTLLCVLVDSSPALRAFEESNGVQAVVKILKRAGTPREVRMKCLEFLYFYLLEEDDSSLASEIVHSPTATAPNSRPATPIQLRTAPNSVSKPKSNPFGASTAQPLSRYGSSTYSFKSSSSSAPESTSSSSKPDLPANLTRSTSPSKSSRPPSPSKASREPPPVRAVPSRLLSHTRSKSASSRTALTSRHASSKSFSSTSSNAASSSGCPSLSISTSTASSSSSSCPSPVSGKGHSRAPSLSATRPSTPDPRSLPPLPYGKTTRSRTPPMLMLRKDASVLVDYVPVSPKKPSPSDSLSSPKKIQVSKLGVGGLGRIRPGVSRTGSGSGHEKEKDVFVIERLEEHILKGKENRRMGSKTIEEKKNLLGTMLGNVDALVDGIRKAGIWGLG